ncbi:MAG: transposase, partial [Microcystis panniformis]
DFYVQRGASSEHRIKELKLGIKADRLSCQKFIVNQFRLFLSQAAYILLLGIRQAAQGTREQETRLAKTTVFRLKETLIKTVAKVSFLVRKVLVELASNCPFAYEVSLISQRLSSGVQLFFLKAKPS